MPSNQEMQDRAHSYGVSFIMAARRLMEQRYTSATEFTMLPGPAIVCYAFSIELILKSILLREGKSVKGHDLLKLFNNLSPESKLNITSQIESSFQVSLDEFNKNLGEIKNSFNDFRYIHETDHAFANLDFITKLADIMSNIR